MEFTLHAAKQAQRRGVDANWVVCVLEYGEEYKGGGGVFAFSNFRERKVISEI